MSSLPCLPFVVGRHSVSFNPPGLNRPVDCTLQSKTKSVSLVSATSIHRNSHASIIIRPGRSLLILHTPTIMNTFCFALSFPPFTFPHKPKHPTANPLLVLLLSPPSSSVWTWGRAHSVSSPLQPRRSCLPPLFLPPIKSSTPRHQGRVCTPYFAGSPPRLAGRRGCTTGSTWKSFGRVSVWYMCQRLDLAIF